ncbi:hypothetical protein [Nonomuraea sp. NPDC048901]|uniref:HAD family hydrolase n=1 Tax=Nonomuraea sp. NPDC048901 TaxID=3155627 RepID=UPI0033D6AC02
MILDAGDVLIADAMPGVFADMAADAGAIDATQSLIEKHISVSRQLWGGEMSETAYWEHLAQALGTREDGHWRGLLATRLRPLVHPRVLRQWAECVDLVLLSNHRTEWLIPAMSGAGYLEHFTQLVISDSVGFVKPDREIFELVNPPKGRALFVDDREFNLTVGRSLGWRTVAGAPDGRWVGKVSALLGVQGLVP